MAILYGRVSRKISHQTVQTLVQQWQRYAQIAENLGWEMLAILSVSASFRQYTLVTEKCDWDNFFLDLGRLKISIELVGAFFCPSWRMLLRNVPERFLNPDAGGYHGHHHLWSIPYDKKALVAQLIAPYEILEKSIPGAKMVFRADPRIIKGSTSKPRVPYPLKEHCSICTKEQVQCECPTHIWFPCRMELFQTKGCGVGVRALQVSTAYHKPTRE